MKKILIALALLQLVVCANAQNKESIVTGNKEIIYSKVLNENRKLWIYTPNITAGNESRGKRYPVLYLLDGDAHFYSTVGIIQQLSQANGNGVLPEMIVVAIENTNRFRDLVPANDLSKINPFVTFLITELIPFIDKNYQAAPYRLLVGHSLGGLTAIDMLNKYPETFNAFIAIDPSMWYANEKFLNNTIARFPKLNMNGKRLFVATANTMPKGMTLSQLKNDKSFETQHIRSILRLDEFLKSNANGLLYSQKYYEREGHNSVPMIGEYDGLRFIFDYYQLDATEKDFIDTTPALASKLKIHYDHVSEKMGYKNSAPETLINYLAYEALKNKNYSKAKALFELNIDWYVTSGNVYDAYADYFLARRDTVNAIANYKKALNIEANAVTQSKLDALSKIKSTNTVDLKKYAGNYTFEALQLNVALVLRNGSLWAVVPGQADDELQVLSNNVFTVKGKPGYVITFEMNGDKPKGFTSVQPDGTFKAIFKSK